VAQDLPEKQPLLTGRLGDWLATVLALALLSPLLADLFAHRFSELAARQAHGLYLGLSGGSKFLLFIILGADGEPRLWLTGGAAVLFAGGLTLWARKLDPAPGTRPSASQRIAVLPWLLLVGLPALAIMLVSVLLAAALEPVLFATLWCASIAGAALGRRRRRPSLAWERSLTGLPAAAWNTDHILRFALLLTPLLALGGAALLARTGDPTGALLRSLEHRVGGDPGILALFTSLALLVALLLAGPTRRALSLMVWEPWVGALIGALLVMATAATSGATDSLAAALALGACIGLAGSALGGAGAAAMPLLSLHPLRAAGRLALPLLAAIGSASFAISTGLLGCDAVRADPNIEVLLGHGGATALAPSESVHPALFVAFPKEGLVTRLSFKGGTDRGVDINKLPTEILDPSLVEIRLRPKLLSRAGDDEVLLLASPDSASDSPGSVAHNGVAVAIDSLTSLPIDTAVTMDACEPGSWAWHPFHSLAVVGCSDRGEIALYEPTLHRFISQQTIPSVPDASSLLVDAVDGSLLLLPRHEGAFLVRYDLAASRTISWRFVGGGNRDLAQDIDGAVYLPRFFSRQVLVLEGEEFAPTRSLAAGLGLAFARPVVGTDTLLAASLLNGRLYALDMTGNSEARQLRVGGLLRDLRVSLDGSRAFAAGMCGVLAIDLDGWLDGSGL